ncbi:DUF72 domain-containing protein [Reyranella sp.]|uniref:DUF72 domain-containing protein n=1 Tax=Reyranella sp. TaxID=1929291 RepID=UPI003BA8D3AE
MAASRRIRSGSVRIGLSGWTYRSWRGRFYPKGLAHDRELAHMASVFDTVEINGTFYSMQRPASFARWADETPSGFVFAVKGPRFLTHMKRLKEPRPPLANFIASGLLRLGGKLGPVLWQLPPTFRFDAERLEAFFALLPRTAGDAAALGRRHDRRLKARAWLRTPAPRQRLRHAIEVRHESFRDPAFIALLRRYDIALVCADTVDWPLLMDLTADFVYVRLHGSRELYRSGYGEDELARWARRIRAWRDGRPMRDGAFAGVPAKPVPRDVFVYFDNTDKLKAPHDAQALRRLLEEG